MPEGNDMSKLLIRSIFTIILLMGLSACGGGGGGSLSGDDSGGTGGTSGSEGDSEELPTVTIGAYVGQTFTAGILKITVSNISSGGTTDVTAFLVDENNDPVEDGIIDGVLFSSPCISQGTASITAPTITVSPGITTAVTTYTASGCEGDDTITAEAILDSTTLSSATGTITIAPQSAGSIAFTSATPPNISVQGAGGAGRLETSKVKFQVFDSDSNPIEGETITFATNTPLGGFSISPTSIDSDADGYVETTVSSGSVPTPVTVIATVASNNAISTQSSGLVISTGLPDQDSMSMSLSKHNVEGLDWNGEEVTVSVWLSDNTNNPVPDGTRVTFLTEGGQMEDSCETAGGSCSATWTSANPKPTDGRVTILAYAEGQESFTDLNSDGLFNQYDSDLDGTPDTLEPFTDMPEAWLDINENGTYDLGLEQHRDTGTLNGVYDAADGVFNGYLCDDNSCTDATKSIFVRKSTVLVMSGSNAAITPTAISSLVPLGTVDDVDDCILLNAGNSSVDVIFDVADANDQQMPVGTTVAVSSTQGTAELISGTTPWPDSNDGATKREYKASIEWDEEAGDGYFSITVTTPKGTESKYTRCVNEE